VFGQLPLDEVKALKHEHGVTVTSTAALFTRGGDRENGRSRGSRQDWAPRHHQGKRT